MEPERKDFFPLLTPSVEWSAQLDLGLGQGSGSAKMLPSCQKYRNRLFSCPAN